MFFIPYSTRERTARQRFPYVNVVVVLLNVAAFAVEFYVLATQGQAGFESFIQRHALVPAELVPLTLLTAMFLHAGLLHIVGNMMFLLPFGDNVEDALGHVRYAIFYLICGIGASLVFALFNRHSTTPLLGASGAIAGVLGGYLALHPIGSEVRGFLFVIILLIKIELPAIVFIGYWFLMQVFSSVASLGGTSEGSGVAFLAHVGGFVIGFLLAPIMALRQRQMPTYRTFE